MWHTGGAALGLAPLHHEDGCRTNVGTLDDAIKKGEAILAKAK